ncbi:ribosome-associated translation inhibitor RaiA [Romboutsia weinsteinii]|uniref:Ribosome hibernation promoting factor n=1 Tax=Romboutsia weinsteinii TaxID=2020949 RepID=A0A371IY18_9FIRM|nr:ribosome-associated translation inhibitor RaiA [Romboutsia weinsteinii]RDY25356.1 ribosome-associated translation inhibitor RaiA [Romboutsia weinsteinii]
MKIIISGKQMELTTGIKNAIEEKLGRLDYYLHPETEVKVTVSAKKSRQKVEVTIVPINGPIVRAEDIEENLYAAIDVVYDKLNKQLRKYKNRLQDRHQDNKTIRYNENDLVEDDNIEYDEDDNFDEILIERRKKFDMKPMSPEEAVLQMELIEHDFYMFKNIDTDELSVVYKRNNGGYGIIEHE